MFPMMSGVRGKGLLLGVLLTEDVAPALVTTARGLGLIINSPAPDVVRIAPPLIIGDEEIEEFLKLFFAAADRIVGDTP